MDKKTLPILILLVIAVVIWIGFSVYFTKTAVDVNPNAQSYLQSIGSQFNTEPVDVIKTRIEKSLPIKPEVFTNIEPK